MDKILQQKASGVIIPPRRVNGSLYPGIKLIEQP